MPFPLPRTLPSARPRERRQAPDAIQPHTDGRSSMNRIQTTIAAFLIAMAGLAVPADSSAQGSAKKPAAAAPAVPGEKVGPGTQYSEKGADTCLDCHDKDADTLTFSTNGIFKSRHGHRRDKGAPFGPGGMQCEACHGPGHVHSTKGSQEKLTINSQKSDSFVPVAQRNAQCLSCHDSRNRTGWHAAAHEKSGLACADCHQMHTDRDAVMGKTSQPDVCFRCHQKQRADFQKASAHPVKHGLMNCADCHNSHGGSATTASLITTSSTTRLSGATVLRIESTNCTLVAPVGQVTCCVCCVHSAVALMYVLLYA